MSVFILTNRVLFNIINKHFEVEGENLINLADMAQVVEHILGKDEVTGSNPVISSTKPLRKVRVFSLSKKRQSLLTLSLF